MDVHANLGEVLPSHEQEQHPRHHSVPVVRNDCDSRTLLFGEPAQRRRGAAKHVVRQNKTVGELEKVNAHYTLLPRGHVRRDIDGAKTVEQESHYSRYEVTARDLRGAQRLSGSRRRLERRSIRLTLCAKAAEDLRECGRHGLRISTVIARWRLPLARQAVQRSEDAQDRHIAQAGG